MAIMQHDGVHYNPFFQHRLYEAEEHLQAIAGLVDELSPLQWLDGHLNPADILTKPYAKPEDLLRGGAWQDGPAFLKQDRGVWPMVVPHEDGAIPPEEVKKGRVLCVGGEGRLREVCREMMLRKTKLSVIVGALARLMAAVQHGDRDSIKRHPRAGDRSVAEKVLVWASQLSALTAWEEGRLQSLNPEMKQGLLVTQGRNSRGRMMELTGKPYLPVLLGKERLAALFCLEAHEDGHFRDPTGILARTRRSVWLVQGREVARRVSRSCLHCRRLSVRPQAQQMGDVADDLARP